MAAKYFDIYSSPAQLLMRMGEERDGLTIEGVSERAWERESER